MMIRAQLADDVSFVVEHRLDRMPVTRWKRRLTTYHDPRLHLVRQARNRTTRRHQFNLMREHRLLFVNRKPEFKIT